MADAALAARTFVMQGTPLPHVSGNQFSLMSTAESVYIDPPLVALFSLIFIFIGHCFISLSA